MGQCCSILKRQRDLQIDRELIDAKFGDYFSFTGKRMGKIVSVYDGDTCTAVFRILPDSDIKSNPLIQYRIRLTGVDTPELKPALSTPNREKIVTKAKEAKSVVEEKILNKIVILDCQGFDKYGRILATIMVDDLNLNEWLIKEKYGVSYDGRTKDDSLAA